MAVNIICIFVAILNFIISLHYFNLYNLERDHSKELYESSLSDGKLKVDLLWCLHLYKKAYDKSFNKLDRNDFDIKYPKQFLNDHSQVVSELHRLEKGIREGF